MLSPVLVKLRPLRALKPGGWIDCSEPGLYFESFYDTLGEDHPYKTWGTAMLEAGNNAGMSFDVGPYMKQWLEDAGFINVKERKFCCTIGKWSNDAWERDVGVWEQRKMNWDRARSPRPDPFFTVKLSQRLICDLS